MTEIATTPARTATPAALPDPPRPRRLRRPLPPGARQTFPGLVFTAYAGFWLSYALLVQFYGPMVTEDGAAITGMFLLAWAIFSTYMLIAALRTNLTTIVIFTLLCVVFYAAAIGASTSSTGLGHLADYVLIADALVALYASAAIIINATWERSVLPVP